MPLPLPKPRPPFSSLNTHHTLAPPLLSSPLLPSPPSTPSLYKHTYVYTRIKLPPFMSPFIHPISPPFPKTHLAHTHTHNHSRHQKRLRDRSSPSLPRLPLLILLLLQTLPSLPARALPPNHQVRKDACILGSNGGEVLFGFQSLLLFIG